MDTLHLHQQLPAESTADKNQTEAEETGDQPEGICLPEGPDHLGTLGGIMEDPPEESKGDNYLQESEEDFF